MMYLNKDLTKKITRLLIYKIWLIKYYNNKSIINIYKQKKQIYSILSSIKTLNQTLI
jgi:hypothetical protein